jgi:hypothetical protein
MLLLLEGQTGPGIFVVDDYYSLDPLVTIADEFPPPHDAAKAK